MRGAGAEDPVRAGHGGRTGGARAGGASKPVRSSCGGQEGDASRSDEFAEAGTGRVVGTIRCYGSTTESDQSRLRARQMPDLTAVSPTRAGPPISP
jgi:hypothetical protein